jgi:hypothetical protein
MHVLQVSHMHNIHSRPIHYAHILLFLGILRVLTGFSLKTSDLVITFTSETHECMVKD